MGITESFAPFVLSLLRIVTGYLLMQHGANKLFGFWAEGAGAMELDKIMWTAGILEFVGGIMIILGLFTKPVALLLSGMMAFAYFMAHAFRLPDPLSFLWTLQNKGELAVLYCFVFLYIAITGGGKYSLDCLIRKCKKTTT